MFIVSSAYAAEIQLDDAERDLQQVISRANTGDTLRLNDAVYPGPIIVDKKLSIVGSGNSVINGNGKGRVITLDAPDIVLRKLVVQNSGIDLSTEDSGIFLTKNADHALVENITLSGNLIGINLKGPDAAIIRNNRIRGNSGLRMNERGNGIHLWNTPGSVIDNNNIRFGRDGIFVTTSKNNIFRNNHISDLRFAIHYMYTNNSEVSGNVSENNHAGFALMYSSHLQVFENHSYGDRDRGLFFNYANYSSVHNNVVKDGVEKCVFIYNSNFNTIRQNYFSDCLIGVHFTAGSEENFLFENSFVSNKTQVKYVGTRHLEWSKDGRGNYWSDHSAFDLNGDGIADQAYKPNNLVDQIIWRNPVLKILVNSPAFQILQWAQSQFPALYPGGVIDSAPLMQGIDTADHVNG